MEYISKSPQAIPMPELPYDQLITEICAVWDVYIRFGEAVPTERKTRPQIKNKKGSSKMEKKLTYSAPELELIRFAVEDIITLSNPDEDNEGEGGIVFQAE